MNYKKVQKCENNNSSAKASSSSSSTNNMKWPTSSSNYTSSSTTSAKHGVVDFPYTTSLERRRLVLEYLRKHPLGSEEEFFLSKNHGIMDVEMAMFPHEERYSLPENADMDDYDDAKCKLLLI